MLGFEKITNLMKLLPQAVFIGFALVSASVSAQLGEPEKDELTFGFIKLTDMAPIAIAYENGYFEDEGLYVTIEAQANWKVLLDGVIDGKLDGAHMLAGQPLAATIGYGTKAHIVTPFSMDLNGKFINNYFTINRPTRLVYKGFNMNKGALSSTIWFNKTKSSIVIPIYNFPLKFHSIPKTFKFSNL